MYDELGLYAAGEALAFLAPSEEEGALAALAARKVPVKRRTFAQNKVTSITPALTALMAKSDNLKTTAQAAFVSYIRSVFLHPDKSTFDISKLDIEAFAESFGLPTVPRVRMIQKLRKQAGRQGAGAHRGMHSKPDFSALPGPSSKSDSDMPGMGQPHSREAAEAVREAASGSKDSRSSGSGSDSDDSGDSDVPSACPAVNAGDDSPAGSASADEADADDLFAVKRADVLGADAVADSSDSPGCVLHDVCCVEAGDCTNNSHQRWSMSSFPPQRARSVLLRQMRHR